MFQRFLSLILFIWVLPAFGQNYLDVLRPFSGTVGQTGRGSAALPASGGGSLALLGNPALLSFEDKSVLTLDMTYDRLEGNSIFNATVWDQSAADELSFNSAGFVKPVRVYRGAWVWALGIQPVYHFSELSRFGDYDPDDYFYYEHIRQQSGTLYAYSLGSSLLATMHTSLGFSLSYFNGSNTFTKVYKETDDQDLFTFHSYLDSLRFQPRYSGFGGRLGVLSQLSETVRIGINVALPTYLNVREISSHDSMERFDNDSLAVGSESIPELKYNLWGPWQVGVGIGYRVAPLDVSLNYTYYSYPTSSFSSNLLAVGGGDLDPLIDAQIEENVRGVHEFSAAMKWALKPLQLMVTASLRNAPLNYRLNTIIRLDTGIVYQLRSGLGLMLNMRNEQWQQDLDHTIASGVKRSVAVDENLTRFMFGVSYTL